jgi:hypothetical protein
MIHDGAGRATSTTILRFRAAIQQDLRKIKSLKWRE